MKDFLITILICDYMVLKNLFYSFNISMSVARHIYVSNKQMLGVHWAFCSIN